MCPNLPVISCEDVAGGDFLFFLGGSLVVVVVFGHPFRPPEKVFKGPPKIIASQRVLKDSGKPGLVKQRISLVFQNPPNTLRGSVFGPPKDLTKRTCLWVQTPILTRYDWKTGGYYRQITPKIAIHLHHQVWLPQIFCNLMAPDHLIKPA